MHEEYRLQPIGVVRSELTDRHAAPRQGHEGAPAAWIDLDLPDVALEGLQVGQAVILLTWFHQADRTVLKLRPRREASQGETGVFNTRSPDRPNPIGLHRVTILEIAGSRLYVEPLEAIDGTPVLDIKPVLAIADA